MIRVRQVARRYAVGLYRVSTAEQGQSGLGLEAQQASVRAFAAAQGWKLVAEFSDPASGKDDHRPGFQAAMIRCRQLGAILTAARLDRITRRAHTLSQLLEDGYSVRAADMPGADDLMLRVYAAMAQKERELISERTRAALTAAKARGAVLGGDRGYRPSAAPCAARAAMQRGEVADTAAHRLSIEVAALQAEGLMSHLGLARALTEWGADAAGSADLDAYDGGTAPGARGSGLAPGRGRTRPLGGPLADLAPRSPPGHERGHPSIRTVVDQYDQVSMKAPRCPEHLAALALLDPQRFCQFNCSKFTSAETGGRLSPLVVSSSRGEVTSKNPG